MPAKAEPSSSEASARRKSLRIHGTIARDLGIHVILRSLPARGSARWRGRGERPAPHFAHGLSRGAENIGGQGPGGIAAEDRDQGQPAAELAPARPRRAVVDLRIRARRRIALQPVRAAEDRRARSCGAGAQRRTPEQIERMEAALESMAKHTLAAEDGRSATRTSTRRCSKRPPIRS